MTLILLANVYGYNTKTDNNLLFDNVGSRFISWLSKYPNLLFVIGGDFNVTVDDSVDRWPPKTKTNSLSNITLFMQKFQLVDMWREKNPNTKSYTWANKTGTCKSRIDYWLISSSLDENNISVNILTTPLTDHKTINLQINFNSDASTHWNTYWKLNNSVLKHKVVTEKIHLLIKCYWQRALNDRCFQKNWELLKFEIAKYLRKYGSSLAKLRNEEETKVITKIASLTQCMPDDLTEDDKQELTEQQLKLDEIYRLKAEGAYVRSRKQWLEEGEQNTAYFFRLEKSRSKTNCIQKLHIDGTVTDDPQKVSNHCLMFYRNLYKSQYDENATKHFFGHLSHLKSISPDQKDLCDRQVTLEEVRSAIQQLKLNTSPGTDGLTSEFYITFCDKVAPFLHGVFNESIHNQTLPPTLYQGLLTLIPKPNKDSLCIDN